MTFISSYRVDRKNEGSGNRESTVVIFIETSHTPKL